MVNQKVCKKKYLSWVYGEDRKICHSGSLFGITRQASWWRSVTLVTDISILTIHPWKILVIFHYQILSYISNMTFSFLDKYFSFQWIKRAYKQSGARLTADHRFVTSPNFNDVTKIGLKTSSATSRARRERLHRVLFLSCGRKNSQQIVFSVYFWGANCVYTHFRTR